MTITQEDRLLILIVRTIGCTQYRTARAVGCRDSKVCATEKWFRELPQEEAEVMVDDFMIHNLAARRLGGNVLTDEQRRQIEGLTADAILFHYDHRPRTSGQPESLAGKPDRHREQLRAILGQLRGQLALPPLEAFFSPQLCRAAGSGSLSGVSLPLRPSAGHGAQGPVAHLPYAASADPHLGLSLPVEGDEGFGDLVEHLAAEEEGFPLEDWRARMEGLLGRCLQRARQVVWPLKDEEGFEFDRPDPLFQVRWSFPAYLCSCALRGEGLNAERLTALRKISAHSWELTTAGDPPVTLAQGSEDHTAVCQQAFGRALERQARPALWQGIVEEHRQLEAYTARLRGAVDGVLKRGSFKGTCPSCPSCPQ